MLRRLILLRFPNQFEKYIEVFGGAAWVMFAKPPKNDFEVYNDRNSLLVNLFRCVREKPEELETELRYVLNSREDFNFIKEMLSNDCQISDVRKAAYFYQLIRYSYASGLTSYGCQPHDIWTDFPLIDAACQRLRNVVVENQDFEKLIRHYDSPESFFYCDPPYYETENYYKNVGEGGFGLPDHIRLRDTLLSMQGKFLLSYNDCGFVRELYNHKDISIESVSRLNNIKQRYDNGCQFEELLIANYDLQKGEQESNIQMSLFMDEDDDY